MSYFVEDYFDTVHRGFAFDDRDWSWGVYEVQRHFGVEFCETVPRDLVLWILVDSSHLPKWLLLWIAVVRIWFRLGLYTAWHDWRMRRLHPAPRIQTLGRIEFEDPDDWDLPF